MGWLILYACGAVVTWFLCIVAGATDGKEKEAIAPAFVAALLWPLAWLYSWAVRYGRFYARLQKEKARR